MTVTYTRTYQTHSTCLLDWNACVERRRFGVSVCLSTVLLCCVVSLFVVSSVAHRRTILTQNFPSSKDCNKVGTLHMTYVDDVPSTEERRHTSVRIEGARRRDRGFHGVWLNGDWGPFLDAPIRPSSNGVAHLYPPSLSLCSVSCPPRSSTLLSDADRLLYFAQHYQLSSPSLSTLCQHNAQVAQQAGDVQAEQSWYMIEMLFETSSVPSHTSFPSTGTNASSKSNDELLPSSPSNTMKRRIVVDCVPVVDCSQYVNVPCAGRGPLDDSSFQRDTIMEYLTQRSECGDVQMCVMVVSALSNRIVFDEEQVRQWYYGYIELLLRHQAFTEAAIIIRTCQDKELRQMNSVQIQTHRETET